MGDEANQAVWVSPHFSELNPPNVTILSTTRTRSGHHYLF
jgi:hypothetical protein